jgi:SagB-type dehydrogenase family enzyme
MNTKSSITTEIIQLPAAIEKGRMSLEETLSRRRSVREFRPEPLTERELSQLVWAAQGITHPEGFRTAPSAGALYPLELYVAMATGFYHYDPHGHRLARRSDRDLRKAMCAAAPGQDALSEAPAVFIITAVYERVSGKYGETRGGRYVHFEVGHAGQNILLEAVALGLGGVPVGAFDDRRIKNALSLPADQQPLYLIPVGHPR